MSRCTAYWDTMTASWTRRSSLPYKSELDFCVIVQDGVSGVMDAATGIQIGDVGFFFFFFKQNSGSRSCHHGVRHSISSTVICILVISHY